VCRENIHILDINSSYHVKTIEHLEDRQTAI
jgi:hypothetical protein